ncbi:response regulator [Bacteroidia bacterium]|nr:response regulator [Bacteroidia bacterium]
MYNYKVLIAEDDPILATIIAKILSNIGIENVCVNAGKDALEEYNREYFDMVLIDIQMADLNGLEVSREIRKTNSHIPIIALTSMPYEEIELDLAKSGINHYIAKPPKASELKKLLLEYFKSAA